MAINDFLNKQTKSGNINKKTATDLNTLSINWKVKVDYKGKNWNRNWDGAGPPFVQIFMNTLRQNGEEYELAAITNFQQRIVQNKRTE